MGALATIVDEVIADLSTVSGLAFASDPKEQLNEFPCCLVWGSGGAWSIYTHDNDSGLGTGRCVHTITVLVFVPRIDMQDDIAKLEPFADAIPSALLRGYARDKFGGSVTCLGDSESRGSNVITYEMGGEEYASQGLEAIRWQLQVTVEGVIYE